MVSTVADYVAELEGEWEYGKSCWRFSYKDGKWSAFAFHPGGGAGALKVSWDDKSNGWKLVWPAGQVGYLALSGDTIRENNGTI